MDINTNEEKRISSIFFEIKNQIHEHLDLLAGLLRLQTPSNKLCA